MTAHLVATAPAKVNLALHVTGRREDGYHLIDTLAVFTRFGDRLELSPAEEDSFGVRGRYAAAVPLDGQNLVLRARDGLRAGHGDRAGPVAIMLEKNLPPASGIGGGSSDAAATLIALNTLWGVGLSNAVLREVGCTLGADVPMCLVGRPLRATGIGEAITPLTGLPSIPLLLVNPAAPVATPAVFAALAQKTNPPLPEPVVFDAVQTLSAWLAGTRNDLEPAARRIEPLVDEALARIDESGATFSRMSGSGATCFGLFETPAEAARAAETIAADRPGWFAVATETLTERLPVDEKR